MMLWPYTDFTDFDILDDGRVRFYQDSTVTKERFLEYNETGFYTETSDFYTVCFAKYDVDEIIDFILKQPDPLVSAQIIESYLEDQSITMLNSMANMVYYNILKTEGCDHIHYNKLLKFLEPHILDSIAYYSIETQCFFYQHGIDVPITTDILQYCIMHGIPLNNEAIQTDVEEETLYL